MALNSSIDRGRITPVGRRPRRAPSVVTPARARAWAWAAARRGSSRSRRRRHTRHTQRKPRTRTRSIRAVAAEAPGSEERARTARGMLALRSAPRSAAARAPSGRRLTRAPRRAAGSGICNGQFSLFSNSLDDLSKSQPGL